MNKSVFRMVVSYILFMIVYSLVANAQETSFPPTILGFNSINESSTPFILHKSASSVFKVEIVSEDQMSDLRVFDLQSDEFKVFESKMTSMNEEMLSAHERVTILRQIERCKRDKIEKACPIMLTFERATAFLAGGDGSFLITNAHVVQRYLKLKASMQGKTILEILKTPQWIPIFLFDKDGKLAFDPYLTPPAIIKFGKPSAFALTNGSGWYGEDSDYVVIKLPVPLGMPLEIAKSKNIGEKVYRLGYSSCTGCPLQPNRTDPELNMSRGLIGNSNGKDLFWTSGQTVGLQQTSDFLGISLTVFDSSNKENWLFFSADAQVGMSGGPIVNELGEVVGVFAGSKPKISFGTMNVLSRGVRPPEFDN